MPAPNGCTALNSKFRQSEPSLTLGHMFFSRTGWNVSGPRGCLIWGRLYWPLCCFGKATFSQHQSACVDAPWTTKVLKEAALVQRTVEQTNNGLAAVLAFVCNSLGWTLNSEEPFYITTTPQGNGFCIKEGGKSFLVEELDHACRKKIKCPSDMIFRWSGFHWCFPDSIS